MGLLPPVPGLYRDDGEDTLFPSDLERNLLGGGLPSGEEALALLLSHAHLDHTGAVAYLRRECDLFRRTVAAGLYMGSMRGVSKGSVLGLGDLGHQDPGAPRAFQADPGPAIFLCPERIVDWGAQEGVPTALVQDQVYYHELAHALMDTAADADSDPYREPWGLVVEESLADWVAVSRFQGSEALVVHRLIKGQPPEYLGYEAVSRLVFFSSELPLTHPLFWEEVLWFIQRGYWPPFLPLPLLGKMGLAPLNLEAWCEAKRRGDWQHPEVENLWEEFALRLLEEGVL